MKLAGRRAVLAYAVAAMLGLALGSYQYLELPSGERLDDAPQRASRTVSPDPLQSKRLPVESGHVPASNAAPRAEPTPDVEDEPASHVFAGAGVVLRPALVDDGFIGYLVVRNGGDRRFAVGDIIISVNDRPVENSAAGSELLIASLADPDAPVEIRADNR